MKREFSLKCLALSVLLAGAGLYACLLLADAGRESVPAALVWGFAAFALPLALGFLGLELGLWLDRKRYTALRPSRVASLLLALLLGGGLGAGCQLIYLVEYQNYTVTSTEDMEYKGVHAVLLMDGSSSMEKRRDACVQAACRLVDGLDENSSVQFAAFANNVMPRNVSDFLPMTRENRAQLQDFIRGTDLAGGTDFGPPLTLALTTLEEHADRDYRSIILMLTDGEAELSPDVSGPLADSDEIDLYTVRIVENSSGSPSALAQALVDLAAEDFTIVPDGDGGVDVEEVLDAFWAALDGQAVVSHQRERLGLGTDLMLWNNSPHYWWRILAGVLGCSLYAAVAGLVYYRQAGRRLAVQLAAGAGTGAVLLAFPEAGLALLVLVCLGAYTTYEIGGTSHV